MRSGEKRDKTTPKGGDREERWKNSTRLRAVPHCLDEGGPKGGRGESGVSNKNSAQKIGRTIKRKKKKKKKIKKKNKPKLGRRDLASKGTGSY